MKRVRHWISVVAGAGFIGWTHAHTDEIPVVLGFILILSAILGGVFPRKPWLTGIIVGIAPFLVESLHNYGVIHAPYPPSVGIPWAPLVAFIPALGGAFFGSAVRNLNKQEKHAG